VGGDVDLLAGIRHQVVECQPLRVLLADQLVAVPSQCAPERQVGSRHVVELQRPGSLARQRSAREGPGRDLVVARAPERGEIEPLDVRRRLGPHDSEHRRHDVDDRHRRPDADAARHGGPGQDQRNPEHLLVKAEHVLVQSVLAELLPVIRRHDDQHVVVQPLRANHRQQSRQLGVELADAGVVEVEQVASGALVELHPLDRPVDLEVSDLAGLDARVLGAERDVVAGQVGLLELQTGAVGGALVGLDEERLVAGFGRVVGVQVVVVDEQEQRAPGGRIDQLAGRVGHQRARRSAIEGCFVEAEALEVARHREGLLAEPVDAHHRRGLVAGRRQHRGEGRHRIDERGLRAHHAVAGGGAACQHGSVRGKCPGCGRARVLEDHAFRGEQIEGRRREARMPVEPQAIGTQRVEGDQQDEPGRRRGAFFLPGVDSHRRRIFRQARLVRIPRGRACRAQSEQHDGHPHALNQQRGQHLTCPKCALLAASSSRGRTPGSFIG